MTHPTTEPNDRERLARRYCAAFWPNHPWDEAAEWQHDASWKAVDTILAELDKISTERDLYVDDILTEIRDGGK